MCSSGRIVLVRLYSVGKFVVRLCPLDVYKAGLVIPMHVDKAFFSAGFVMCCSSGERLTPCVSIYCGNQGHPGRRGSGK